jgi:hypothetical protein
MYSVKYLFTPNFYTFQNKTNGNVKKKKKKNPYYTILHAPSQNVNHQKGKDGCFQSKTPFKYVATHND